MKNLKTWLAVSALTVLPLMTYAQLTETETLIRRTHDMVRLLIGVVAGIALLVFFWGLVKFIFSQGSETAKTEGKKVMVWGLIALFVMMSVWGIIGFIQSDLGLPVTTDGSSNENPQIIDPFNLPGGPQPDPNNANA